MSPTESIRLFAEDLSKRLNGLLLAGEYEQAKKLLESLADQAEQQIFSQEELSHIVYEVVLNLTNVALRHNLPTVQLQQLYDGLFANNAPFSEGQQRFLRQVLPNFLNDLCYAMQACDDLSVRMERYIDLHILHYTFSVQNMANYFAVSQIELRRVFHNKTGQHLREYIWERRLEKAKELLKNTDRPIREVVQSVGYIDVSNFTRKFRMATGYTPGEYRAVMKRGGMRA